MYRYLSENGLVSTGVGHQAYTSLIDSLAQGHYGSPLCRRKVLCIIASSNSVQCPTPSSLPEQVVAELDRFVNGTGRDIHVLWLNNRRNSKVVCEKFVSLNSGPLPPLLLSCLWKRPFKGARDFFLFDLVVERKAFADLPVSRLRLSMTDPPIVSTSNTTLHSQRRLFESTVVVITGTSEESKDSVLSAFGIPSSKVSLLCPIDFQWAKTLKVRIKGLSESATQSLLEQGATGQEEFVSPLIAHVHLSDSDSIAEMAKRVSDQIEELNQQINLWNIAEVGSRLEKDFGYLLPCIALLEVYGPYEFLHSGLVLRRLPETRGNSDAAALTVVTINVNQLFLESEDDLLRKDEKNPFVSIWDAFSRDVAAATKGVPRVTSTIIVLTGCECINDESTFLRELLRIRYFVVTWINKCLRKDIYKDLGWFKRIWEDDPNDPQTVNRDSDGYDRSIPPDVFMLDDFNMLTAADFPIFALANLTAADSRDVSSYYDDQAHSLLRFIQRSITD